MSKTSLKHDLLTPIQTGQELTLSQELMLAFRLSLPAMLAQVSTIIMEYIDASMVGQLGANDSASIGLVSTSTWLFGGVCMAATIGFTVQVAQSIGAGEPRAARGILKQSLFVLFGISLLLLLVGVGIASSLPAWLGGDVAIQENASRYFLIYMLALPVMQMNSLAGGMLQCSGNMKIPGLLNVLMCGLDMLLNELLIFSSHTITVYGFTFDVPGAGLGVAGAALGTALAEGITALLMLWFLLGRSPSLRLHKGEPLKFSASCMKKAVKLAVPVAFERIVLSGAMVLTVRILAPLGTIAIAANSFAVTAESLCYMPGYGIANAATTLVGQSFGARRKELSRRLARITVALGMAVMTCTGVLMYVAAPLMIGLLTPSAAIQTQAIAVLRIEAFAEPLFAASIVASGAFRGAGDSLVPSCLNFLSMWAVRLPLSALLAPVWGLRGVWFAMCTELCVRGILFLLRLHSKRWLRFDI